MWQCAKSKDAIFFQTAATLYHVDVENIVATKEATTGNAAQAAKAM